MVRDVISAGVVRERTSRVLKEPVSGPGVGRWRAEASVSSWVCFLLRAFGRFSSAIIAKWEDVKMESFQGDIQGGCVESCSGGGDLQDELWSGGVDMVLM